MLFSWSLVKTRWGLGDPGQVGLGCRGRRDSQGAGRATPQGGFCGGLFKRQMAWRRREKASPPRPYSQTSRSPGPPTGTGGSDSSPKLGH